MSRRYPQPVRAGHKARPVNPTMPTKPGVYYWDEWQAEVSVFRKKGGRHLYVRPPGGVEIRVTPQIAGKFTRAGASA